MASCSIPLLSDKEYTYVIGRFAKNGISAKKAWCGKMAGGFLFFFFFHFACRSSRCSDPKLTERLEQANESAKCINLHQYACAAETVQCAK